MDQPRDEEFTAFVVGRTHALVRTAYALTGNQHAAEDLVQTAFAKAYARWRRIRDNPEPYVRRIIYHDFVSTWRSRRRRIEVTVAELPDHPARRELADDSVLRVTVRNAIVTLPPRQRAVIILRYLEDLSVAETAAVLGCREGTVVSQASRALAKLRRSVPDMEPPSRHLNGVIV